MAEKSPVTDDGVLPETRDRYLAIAAQLVHHDIESEPAFAHVVSHIKFSDVAQHLGVARSRLYRLWDTQHDYWRDLATLYHHPTRTLARGCDSQRRPSPRSWRCRCSHRVSPGPVRTGAIKRPERCPPDRPGQSRRLPQGSDLAARLLDWHQDRQQVVADRLASMLTASGRVPVEPLTYHDLAAMIWLMAVGTALLGRTDPTVVDVRLHLAGDQAPPSTLLAYAARAILIELSRPDDGSHPPPASSAVIGDHPDPTMDDDQIWSPDHLDALTAGAELFAASIDVDPDHPSAPRGPLGHVTLARVARAAGVSRRRVHHLWASQESLSRDLVRYLRDHDHQNYFEQFDTSVADAFGPSTDGHPATVENIGLRVVEQLFAERLIIPESPADPFTPVPIVLQPHLGDPVMRDQSRRALDRLRAFQQKHIDALTEVFEVGFRDGLTAEYLSILIVMASNGSVALHHLDPHSMRRGIPYRDGAYSVLAIACQALIDHTVVAR